VLDIESPQDNSAAGKIMPFKNVMTLQGIEPAIFRLIAQYLIQLRYRVLYTSLLGAISKRFHVFIVTVIVIIPVFLM
jgi:hypothetical protein